MSTVTGSQEWLVLEHPSDKHEEDGSPVLYHFDITWLLSAYTCQFGTSKCPSTMEDRSDDCGCCAFGFVVDGDDDLKHINAMVAELTDEDWQNKAIGEKRGWYKQRSKDELNSRLVNNVCIFHNADKDRLGCAFHKMAERKGLHHTETKPQVCWQVPICMDYDDEDDVIIRAMLNHDWGGGEWEPLDWWCITDTDTYDNSVPVYKELEVELRKLVGDMLYEQMASYCRVQQKAMKRTKVGLPIIQVT